MHDSSGPTAILPHMPRQLFGFRTELLSPTASVPLNRSLSSSSAISVSRNSAFEHYSCRRSATPTTIAQSLVGGGLEKSHSSAAVIFNGVKDSEFVQKLDKKPLKMDSFELHIDIPIDGYLALEPNSSTITPSPKPDPIPESEYSTLKKQQFFKPLPFIEFVSPVSPPTPSKKTEPEKSAHFKEILSLFQNAAHERQSQRRQLIRPKPFLKSRLDSQSFDESSGRSSSDCSLHKPLNLKMPKTTTIITTGKAQTRSLITEHVSSEEEDRGIVKDIIFQNNQKRIPIERKNPPMIRSTNSLLSLDVNEPKMMMNRFNDSLSVSMYSPQSNKNLHSPTGSVRSRASDGLFRQMATSHSSTLAYVSESFPKLLREFGPLASVGHEIFENACLSNIVFKSNTPVFVKDKIALFDAAFIASNYMEYPITVLVSPAGQYAPLLGRHAEISGFGPSILAEFEELEMELRHFLQESGYEQKPMSTLRIVVMPPMNICSLQSLAAHYSNKNLNVNKCEEQICFIMIQLLSALKCLQSDGIEQLSNNFKEFILSYANPNGKSLLQTMDALPRLMLLKDTMEEDCNEDQLSMVNGYESNQNGQQNVGVCKFALRALCTLLNRKLQGTLPEIPERTRFSTALRKCAQILNMDRSNSMSEAKQLLELSFFGNNLSFENEYEAKLWLDERRASFVSQLIRWLIQRDDQIISPKQQIYLYFLLSSTPRGIFKICHQLRRK